VKRLLPVLAAATVSVTALAGCSGDDDPMVQVGEVGRTTVAETVDAPGTVGARSAAAVSAPTDAKVEQVLVEDGATAKAGDVLVRLSSPAAQERLRQAQAAQTSAASGAVEVPRADVGPLQDALDAAADASFAAGRAAAAQISDPERRRAAQAQVGEAEQRYRAASAAARRSLQSLDAGAQSVQDALAALAGSQRAQASAAVSAAQSLVDALTVKAPISGVVTLGGDAGAAPAGNLGGLLGGLPPGVAEQAGAALGAASGSAATTTSQGLAAGAQVRSGTPLLTVTDVGGLTVTAEVDETDVLLVQTGQSATVELDAVPDATYPATVVAVDVSPTASAGGGVTYRVRLTLAGGTTVDSDPAPRPRPGMSAIVELEVRTAESVLAVPSAAVVRDGGKDAVFVVEDGRAQRVEVVVGAQGEELVEIRRGLSGGEQVVVRDADRLSDGQAVQR
jgi:multidrug efflux pump subunit AcrA (membrane-fusion protein)